MNWHNLLLGEFDPRSGQISLDLRNNFLDPLKAEITFIHELAHSAMASTTEMGLAFQTIYSHVTKFSHLTEKERTAILISLREAQLFPQEGFATFLELSRLRRKKSRALALRYAEDALPQDYLDRFKALEYAFDLTPRYMDFFTGKTSLLVLGTNFRIDAPKLDLLRSPKRLSQYLKEPQNNPSRRLEILNQSLPFKTWIVTKPVDQIARACGVKYFPPASKEEVAEFQNYIFKLANLNQITLPEMVADPPEISSTPLPLADNIVVTNINHNLAKTSDFLSDLEAMKFEAEHADVAALNRWPNGGKHDKLFQRMSGMKPEYGIVLFRRSGEKYTLLMDATSLLKILENELKDKTLIVKPDLYDFDTGNLADIGTSIKTSLILYTNPNELQGYLKKHDAVISKAEYIHSGTSQNHPYQSIMLRLNSRSEFHVLTTFGNVKILEIIENLGARTAELKATDLLAQSTALNDYYGIMGMPWNVDWIGTMVSQVEVKLRQ